MNDIFLFQIKANVTAHARNEKRVQRDFRAQAGMRNGVFFCLMNDFSIELLMPGNAFLSILHSKNCYGSILLTTYTPLQGCKLANT